MRPEHARQRLAICGVARARMYLKAHLDWLDGFPVMQSDGRVEWRKRPRVGAPEGNSILLDRNQVHQSEVTLTTLVRHFRNSLSKLFDDVDEWEQDVRAVLDRVRAAIHSHQDVVTAEASPQEKLSRQQRVLIEQITQQHPTLGQLFRSVCWFGRISSSRQDFYIRWFSENATWIEDVLRIVELDTALSTIFLVGDLTLVDGPRCTEFVRVLLGNRSFLTSSTRRTAYRAQVAAFTSRLRKWRSARETPPERPRNISNPDVTSLFELIRWLSTQSTDVRGRATQFANLLILPAQVLNWETAWRKLDTAVHRAVRSLSYQHKVISKGEFPSEASRIASQLEEDLNDLPPSLRISEILEQIKEISLCRSPKFHRALFKLLSAIPREDADGQVNATGCALRFALLIESSQIKSECDGIFYYGLCHQTLRASNGNLRPWLGLVRASEKPYPFIRSPRITLRIELPDKHRWNDFFSVIERVAADENYSHEKNDTIAWLLRISTSVDQTCNRFRELAAHSWADDCDESQLRAASTMENDKYPFISLLKILGPESSINSSDLPSVTQLHQKFVQAERPNVIPDLLLKQRHRDVIRVARLHSLANRNGIDWDCRQNVPSGGIPPWAQHVDSQLHNMIAEYSATFPESCSRIQRMLNKEFPDPGKLRQEIDVLERLMREGKSPQSDRLQIRLKNLTQRLAGPKILAEGTLQRMLRKIEEAFTADIFRDASDRIENGMMTVFCKLTGSRQLREHLHQSAHLELLQGILDLDDPYRSYGIRLLRKEWGTIPWDLAEEPENRQFLDRLVSRGIRIEPWLSSRSRQVTISGQASPWTIAFESHEDEKLLMGYYFDTCLSPGQVNFFSAVVNAIEINKRVLYARNANGEVVGRALFAIGDAGTILVFRPYCDQPGADFVHQVSLFAADLAREMGTIISTNDPVSVLMAPRWWDDGAWELGNSITDENSIVRTVLRESSELMLKPALEQALQPIGLSDSALELLVELPEFQNRPQLIVPLVALIEEREKQLAPGTMVTTGRLCHAAGLTDIASRLIRRYGPEYIRRHTDADGEFQQPAAETMELLIRYQPTYALRTLRTTRPVFVESDQDETDSCRRRMLSECFAALGRRQLAIAMQNSTSCEAIRS